MAQGWWGFVPSWASSGAPGTVQNPASCGLQWYHINPPNGPRPLWLQAGAWIVEYKTHRCLYGSRNRDRSDRPVIFWPYVFKASFFPVIPDRAWGKTIEREGLPEMQQVWCFICCFDALESWLLYFLWWMPVTSLHDSNFTCPFSGRKLLSQEDTKKYVISPGSDVWVQGCVAANFKRNS